MNPAPGKPTMAWEVFAGLHLHAATPAKREAIRCHLLGLRLLAGDSITNPEAAYRALASWQQPATTYNAPPAQPKPTRPWAETLRLLEDGEITDDDLTPEESDKAHEYYLRQRIQRNGQSSCRLW